jgi:16S rRNA (adenine1518-N6/adenine1519-N6)-dimethyltransferase
MSDMPPAKKSLGQHWLHDEASLLAMCDSAELDEKDAVLEIGPGSGTLTGLLVKKAGKVIAVELDEKLARDLPARVKAGNLEVVQGDILRFDLSRLPKGYKLVANIPYYLTSHLIRTISETPNPPAMAVLLMQKEVAERVVAKPGHMSLLSATAQFYWAVELGREVPAELFTPPPKVDSQILMLERHSEPLFPGVDETIFFRLMKAGFSQRRKTLLNTLSAGLGLSRERTEVMCGEANVDPGLRAQALSLDNWHMLYRAYNP